jgi:hypothetical protein
MYLPFVQYGHPELLTKTQRETLWDMVEIVVRRAERRHFNKLSQPERNHEDRVLAFYELAQARWNETPEWVIAAYQRGFCEIEALLQLRRMGVSLLEYDKNCKQTIVFPILQYKRWFVRLFVDYFIVRRRQEVDPSYTYADLYYERKLLPPSKETMKLWRRRTRVLEELIGRSTEPTYGFAKVLSLDEALDGDGHEDCIFQEGMDSF